MVVTTCSFLKKYGQFGPRPWLRYRIMKGYLLCAFEVLQMRAKPKDRIEDRG
jgi:hypothetical protein